MTILFKSLWWVFFEIIESVLGLLLDKFDNEATWWFYFIIYIYGYTIMITSWILIFGDIT